MGELFSRLLRFVIFALVLVSLVAASRPAQAQGKKTQVLALVREAMEAYSSLDLDKAKKLLEEALAQSAHLDKPTLARIYVNLGILAIGGFTDNAEGRKHFVTALCLDPSVMVDPLYSNPEIDRVFNRARNRARPKRCRRVLSKIQTDPASGALESIGALPACGTLLPVDEQKKRWEIPFYLELDPSFQGRLEHLVLKYAFDAAKDYRALGLQRRGLGYGVLLSCDEGQIRVFDPSTVYYYVEGYDASGKVVCSHGDPISPLKVSMSPDAKPLLPFAGMNPQECAPCPPWDEHCGQSTGLPGLGDPCQPNVGCAEGLACTEMGFCEMTEETAAGEEGVGPRRLYFTLTGGFSFGVVKQDVTIRKYNPLGGPEDDGVPIGALETWELNPSGIAFGGIPVRLAMGLMLSPRFSLEVVGKLDAYLTTKSKLTSCAEAAANQGVEPEQIMCSPDIAEYDVDPEKSVALTENARGEIQLVETSSTQVAWQVDARARYALVVADSFRFSLFGGLGYAHLKYRVPGEDDSVNFPFVSGFNLELGPGMAVYLSDNFGFVFDVPIDFVFGDGFGLSFELDAGIAVGF